MGLLCAEQTVGNLKHCTFRNSGAPVRRTKRRTFQTMHSQEPSDSCAQNKNVRNLNKWTFRIFGTPVRRTKRRKSQTWTFRNSGTPVRRTKRRKSPKNDFQEFWDSCALLLRLAFWLLLPSGPLQNAPQNHPKSVEPSSGQPRAPSCSSSPDEKPHFAT